MQVDVAHQHHWQKNNWFCLVFDSCGSALKDMPLRRHFQVVTLKLLQHQMKIFHCHHLRRRLYPHRVIVDLMVCYLLLLLGHHVIVVGCQSGGSMNDWWINKIIKYDLLSNVIAIFECNGFDNCNLLHSTCLSLFNSVNQNNIIELVGYIGKKQVDPSILEASISPTFTSSSDDDVEEPASMSLSSSVFLLSGEHASFDGLLVKSPTMTSVVRQSSSSSSTASTPPALDEFMNSPRLSAFGQADTEVLTDSQKLAVKNALKRSILTRLKRKIDCGKLFTQLCEKFKDYIYVQQVYAGVEDELGPRRFKPQSSAATESLSSHSVSPSPRSGSYCWSSEDNRESLFFSGDKDDVSEKPVFIGPQLPSSLSVPASPESSSDSGSSEFCENESDSVKKKKEVPVRGIQWPPSPALKHKMVPPMEDSTPSELDELLEFTRKQRDAIKKKNATLSLFDASQTLKKRSTIKGGDRVGTTTPPKIFIKRKITVSAHSRSASLLSDGTDESHGSGVGFLSFAFEKEKCETKPSSGGSKRHYSGMAESDDESTSDELASPLKRRTTSLSSSISISQSPDLSSMADLNIRTPTEEKKTFSSPKLKIDQDTS